MLVNTHKQAKILIMLIAWSGQSVWSQSWSLKQCLDTAIAHNKPLEISRNGIEISEQKNKEAKAGFIPKIQGNADYKYYIDLPYQLMPLSVFGGPDGQFKEVQFGVQHNLNFNGQIAMPIFNPQLIGGIEGSRVGIDLSKLQYQKSEEQLLFDMHQLYYNAQALEYQVGYIDSSIANMKKLLTIVSSLQAQQMAKRSDVGKIELQISQLNTQKEIVSNRYEQVISAMLFTMGIEMSREIKVEKLGSVFESGDYSRHETTEIQIAKIQEKRLQTELKALKLSYLPSLSMYATYGAMGLGYDKAPNKFINFYPMGFAGVQFSYPLFDGTITLRKIKQKKTEIKNSKLQTELSIEQNEMLTGNAIRQRKQAYQTVENAKKQIQLATTLYDQVLLQHRQGLASLNDVLMSDNSLREAEQTYVNAVIEYLKSDIELKRLTGNKLYNQNK